MYIALRGCDNKACSLRACVNGAVSIFMGGERASTPLRATEHALHGGFVRLQGLAFVQV